MPHKIPTRKPKRHDLEPGWEEPDDQQFSPEVRYVLSKCRLILEDALQDYDVVVNGQESGYRNQGVYIYYDSGLHELGDEPDDYGSLPHWVPLRKEDFGWSYFGVDDYNVLIDHNQSVPFHPDEWTVGKSVLDDEDLDIEEWEPFHYYQQPVDVHTTFTRKADGCEINMSVTVMASAPWIGGPKDHCHCGGGGSGGKLDDGSMSYTYFRYRDGTSEKQVTVSKKDEHGTYRNYLPLALRSVYAPVQFTQQDLDGIRALGRHVLLSYLDRVREGEGYTFFELTGPCEVAADCCSGLVGTPGIWTGQPVYILQPPLDAGPIDTKKHVSYSCRHGIDGKETVKGDLIGAKAI